MRFGVDVSAWQGDIDWNAVKGNMYPAISFAYAKATEGTSYRDPYFDLNHDQARREGLDFGAYHYFRFEEDPNEQAALFIATTLTAGRGGTLLPMVDVETGAADAHTLAIFTAAVEKAYNVPFIIIYTDSGFWDSTGLADSFSGHPLWIANFVHEGNMPEGAPFLPQTGGWASWKLWQYDNEGAVSGIGNTDLDACQDLDSIRRPGL